MTAIGNELGISQQTASEHAQKAIKRLRKNAKSDGLLSLLLPWKWNFKLLALKF